MKSRYVKRKIAGRTYMEHRLVMAAHLGRELLATEQVHRPTRLGRPPHPVSERRALRRVQIPCTEDEHDALTAWAAREGQPLAVLIRERSLRAARRAE